ncbi:serine protease inhibitor Kazal-type 5-like isoform X2 [Rhineura floridana]|uniref:serine protease inhibitor Kazal-type 5-like isoform X1 n=1 Tax=Rhineura floridana TaxID=261503 RepID=UPI002AC88692|nr:serine protease inhibitor Kazal-type 5-like isoform X1 [Rhineura floridana]XP_061473497.1 serine protease inhibitor Kazal-type 5-like isoform X2 [Rhineura floridana]
MKVAGVFVVLGLFSHFQDVASQAKYQVGTCREFQPLLQDGNLYCNRDIDPVFGPDGRKHTNKCVMCRKVLRNGGLADDGGQGWPRDSSSATDNDCSEYWRYFRDGTFSCTRENNPVRDPSGRQHNNKCMMCLEKFKNGGRINSAGNNQPQNVGNERRDECYEYRSQVGPDGELTCTRENNPVRDASGQTHSNKCIMCAQKFKKEAKEGKISGSGYGGGNGRGEQSPNTYGNRIVQGNLNQGSINKKNCNQYGRNDVNNPCSAEYQIAQGDYRSYTNCGGIGESSYYSENVRKGPFSNRQKRKAIGAYKLDCDKILADLKKGGTSCNALWSPVCGTDGKTYSNPCFLCSEIVKAEDILTLKHEGECPEVHGMVDCSQYPQTKGRVLCKRSTQEVCGTDGETYSNECMLCDRILKTKSEIGIKNIGPCPKI